MITEEKILENIRKIRENKGFSQENIASFLGIKQGGYNLIENGKRKLTIQHLLQIAIYFEMNIVDVITFSEPKENREKEEPIKAVLQIELKKDKKDQVLKLVFGENNLEILNK